LHKWEVHGDHFCSRCNLLKPHKPLLTANPWKCFGVLE
jgi:hypothetical protein